MNGVVASEQLLAARYQMALSLGFHIVLASIGVALAVTDPEAPFRTPVGADAHLILDAKSSMSFEDFERAMRATINWYE